MFDSVEAAIAEVRKGKMIVVVDDKSRENEGDIIFAASKSTPEKINFLAKYARGLICVALTSERVESLELPLMVQENSDKHGTAFTVSVEAKQGTTTGISARDRSITARALADKKFTMADFVRPGHIFPLKAKRGGVLVRAGHTEAAVDLVSMAGLGEAGVICEIMNENGSMARLKDCISFSKKHGLKIISVEDLIVYRRKRERLVKRVSDAMMPTQFGNFKAYVYADLIHGRHHLALVSGEVSARKPVNCRVHVECILGDVFHSSRCDCGDYFLGGLNFIASKGGIFLYLRQPSTEDHLFESMKRFALEDSGAEAKSSRVFRTEERSYGIGAQIIYDIGARKLNLLTNHPKRILGLEGYGLSIDRHTPIPVDSQHGSASVGAAIKSSKSQARKTRDREPRVQNTRVSSKKVQKGKK